jgi:hypothetical protein
VLGTLVRRGNEFATAEDAMQQAMDSAVPADSGDRCPDGWERGSEPAARLEPDENFPVGGHNGSCHGVVNVNLRPHCMGGRHQ